MMAGGHPPRLKIVDATTAPGRALTDDKLAGRGMVHPLSIALGTEQVRVNSILFEPGARFRPHRHPLDQILYYVYGTGIVAFDGGEDIQVPAGSCVILPADVIHMHGCTNDGPAMHLSIMRESDTSFDVECPPAWARWAYAP